MPALTYWRLLAAVVVVSLVTCSSRPSTKKSRVSNSFDPAVRQKEAFMTALNNGRGKKKQIHPKRQKAQLEVRRAELSAGRAEVAQRQREKARRATQAQIEAQRVAQELKVAQRRTEKAAQAQAEALRVAQELKARVAQAFQAQASEGITDAGVCSNHVDVSFHPDQKLGMSFYNEEGTLYAVTPGSQASIANVKVGWTIAKVDGHPYAPYLLNKLAARGKEEGFNRKFIVSFKTGKAGATCSAKPKAPMPHSSLIG